MLGDPLVVVSRISAALDRLGIRYVVGGSVASSVYGVPRATQDVDLVAEIYGRHVSELTALLEPDFYVDADMIREALRRQASFNVVHLPTMFKADIFIFKREPWMESEMGRGRTETIPTEHGDVTLRFASPEDTLLHKLLWYQMGNEISERQWSDILGILKIQGGRLDDAYLDHWAPELGVSELLRRARAAGHK